MTSAAQPGYDALAELYDETFPTAYGSAWERHAVAAFADEVHALGTGGTVLDVGCGTGHVTADLAGFGLTVIGIDPSREMVRIARGHHPDLRFVVDDAHLNSAELTDVTITAILARFSLIHVPPDEVSVILREWATRMAPGSMISVATQSTDNDDVAEFDHVVARAWRWPADRLSEALADAGFDEVWRIVSRPDDQHRFPAVVVTARRAHWG
ncbi:class I SAM-dependent methyltransferase [Gordonia sp. OPL2]|uniref:class I SAM-dependent methyltransferase n=1 Tax=Gordonia sp. OPL2 TaxID=2486274 RepID=UPI0021CCC958|nr:class I SAM-dependent methyltransferase [Gordonia sp. OPL2]